MVEMGAGDPLDQLAVASDRMLCPVEASTQAPTEQTLLVDGLFGAPTSTTEEVAEATVLAPRS